MEDDRSESATAGSVTRLIEGLKEGDDEALRELWPRYFQRLVALARARLGNVPRAAADEEDVALSAFKSLWNGAQHGRFVRLSDRDDLWKLLVVLTTRKAIDQMRGQARQRRGGGTVVSESALEGCGVGSHPTLAQIASTDPTPEFAAVLAEEYHRRLAALDDDVLKRIATLRMEGYTNEEIAATLNVVPRTVIRKISRIRDTWSGDVERPGDGNPDGEGGRSWTAA
jgi:DNA-directed RNA polymerase specialized sigma24 family protein